MSTKKLPPKGNYPLESQSPVEGDFLQVIAQGEFLIFIDGEFRGPYSPAVRRVVVKLGKNERDILVKSKEPVTLRQWHSGEDLDPVPTEVPIHRQQTLHEMVRDLVRYESLRAREEGEMTFEEFDDLGDESEFEDDFPPSPFEVSDMQEDAEYLRPSAQSAQTKGSPHEPQSQKPPQDPVEEHPPS